MKDLQLKHLVLAQYIICKKTTTLLFIAIFVFSNVD